MDARVTRSRQAIIQAGLKLLIQNEESTLVDIAKAADVGRATVYRQFKNKEELQERIAFNCLDRFDEVNMLVEIKASDPLDAISLIFQNIVPLYSEFTFLSKFERALKSNLKLQSKIKAQDNEIRDLIDLAIKQEFISSEYSVDWVFYFFEGLLWAAYQTSQLDTYSSSHAAELAFVSFTSGVGQ